MATNQARWVKSFYDGVSKPMLAPGLFAAGSSQAIKMGELLEHTGTGNTQWVPMDADFDMSAALSSGGKAAIAHCEIKSGDLAGYYPVIAPRYYDVFEYDLLSSDTQNPAHGTALYWNTNSETVSTTAGTNIIGHIAGWGHYPYPQGFASDDASFDRGTTRRNLVGGRVHLTIEVSNGFASHFQGT